MAEIKISEEQSNGEYITYLYYAIADELALYRGRGKLIFGDGRTALSVSYQQGAGHVLNLLREKIAEVICIGYKYRYLQNRLNVCLGERERKNLVAALISADLDGDKAYVRQKLTAANELAIDGVYHFRLSALREKWERIADYVPEGFSNGDLKKFCDFLVGESCKKIYVKGKCVFGDNFAPLRRSKLAGGEDIQTEILLADAGYVYCLGEVEEGIGDFLQKYYADRAIFS